jgi:hypothetical protein
LELTYSTLQILQLQCFRDWAFSASMVNGTMKSESKRLNKKLTEISIWIELGVRKCPWLRPTGIDQPL